MKKPAFAGWGLCMPHWAEVLLMKPVLAVAWFAGFLVLLGIAKLIAIAIRPLFPEGRLKHLLFVGDPLPDDGTEPTGANERGLNDAPLLRRDSRK